MPLSPIELLSTDEEFRRKLQESNEGRARDALDFKLESLHSPEGDALLDGRIANDRAANVVNHIDQGQKIGPDKVLTAVKNFDQTGDPESTGLAPKEMEELLKKLRSNNTLLDYYERNPDAAMIAPKDIPVLEDIGNLFTGVAEFGTGAVRALIRGDNRSELQQEVHRTAREIAFARNPHTRPQGSVGLGEALLATSFGAFNVLTNFRDPLTEAQAMAEHADAKRKLAEFGPPPEPFSLEQTFETAGQIFDQLQGYAIAGAKGAVAGGLITGIPTALAASPTGVGAIPAFLSGAAPGALVGAQAAAAVHIFDEERASAYTQGLEIRDDNGNPLDEDVLQGTSALYGGLSTIVELWALNTGAKFFSAAALKTVKSQLKSRVFSLLRDRATRITMGEIGKRYLKGAAAEATEEVIQTFLGGITEDLSKLAGGEFKDVENVSDLLNKALSPQGIDEMMQSAFAAGTGMLVLGLPSIGTASISARAQFKTSERNLQFFDGLSENVPLSELREKAPGLFREFVTQLSEDTDLNSVFISPEDIVKAFEQGGVEAESVLPGIGEKIAEAEKTGRDVEIPMADFAEKVAPESKLFNALRTDIKLDENGESNRELVARIDQESEAETESANVIEALNKSADRVSETFVERVMSTGRVTEEIARTAARIFRVRFLTESIQMSNSEKVVTPEELFNEFPLDIEGTIEQARVIEDTQIMEQPSIRASALRLGDQIFEGANHGEAFLAGEEVLTNTPGNIEEGFILVDEETGEEQFISRDETLGMFGEDESMSLGELLELPESQLGAAREDSARTVAGLDKLYDRNKKTFSELVEKEDEAPGPVEKVRQFFQPDRAKQQFKLSQLAAAVPGLANVLPLLTDQESRKLQKDTAARLVAFFESLPTSEEMAAIAWAGRAKRGWYKDSADAILETFGVEDAPRFAALLAAMSPLTDVETNLLNAMNVWVGWEEAGRPPDRAGILRVMGQEVQQAGPNAKGGEASVLGAWKNNAVRALTSEDPATFTLTDERAILSGPKANSFMLNLLHNVQEVTLDTWMANYALIEQSIFGGGKLSVQKTDPGKVPGYLAMAARVREAAAIATEQTGFEWTPAEIQETIWSFVKTLYEKVGSAEEDRTAEQILNAAGLLHEEVSDTPDFAVLFTEGIYKQILLRGKRGESIQRLEERNRQAGREQGPTGSVTEAEGSGVAQDAFDGHLARAAGRLDSLRIDRAAGDPAGSADAALHGLADTGSAQESLRAVGLLDDAGSLAFVGDDDATVRLGDLHLGAKVTPSAWRSVFRAFGFEIDPGTDTNAELKIYPLTPVFGTTVESVDAALQPWLESVGFEYRLYGPHAGPDGKAMWPDFQSESTPTYEDGVVWIFDPSEDTGSFMDAAYTLAWRVTHEVSHALVNDQLTEKYQSRGRRAGALGAAVKGPFFPAEDPIRTLNDAMRAVEWEHETFKVQREALASLGVEISDEQFNQENSLNLVGAVARALSGQFADPGDLGVHALDVDPDALLESAFDVLRVANDETRTFDQPAFHGGVASAHLDGGRLRADFSGTGSGNAQGFGIYASELVEIARYYRDLKKNDFAPVIKVSGSLETFFNGFEMYRDVVDDVADVSHNRAAVMAFDAIMETDAAGLEEALARLEEQRRTSPALKKKATRRKGKLSASEVAASFNSVVDQAAVLLQLHTDFENISIEGGDEAAVHEIQIPENEELAHWDANLAGQPEGVREKLFAAVGGEQAARDALAASNALMAEAAKLKYPPKRDLPGAARSEEVARIDAINQAALDSSRTLPAVMGDWLAGPGQLFSSIHDRVARGPGKMEAAKLFNDAGIPGHTYKSGSGDHMNFVIWDDTAIEQISEFQQPPEGTATPPRGNISFDSQGAVMRLFEAADASTLMHEMMHFFVEQLTFLARTRPNAELEQQLATLMEWAEVETPDELSLPYADGRLFRDEVDKPHERLARAFEVYLAEGNAPTAKLDKVFAKLRGWIGAAYGGMKEVARDRGIQLDPQITEIFDLMLVVEREVDEASSPPVFSSAQEMGVTEEEFTRYRNIAADAEDSAKRKLAKRLIGQQRRDRKAARKQLRDEIRARVEQEVSDDPAWQAMNWLSRGTLPEGAALVADTNVGLDRDAVNTMFGGDAARIIELLNGKTKGGRNVVAGASANGLNPEDVAGLFGFRTGRALVDGMLAARALDERVAQAVNQEIAAREDLNLGEEALENAAMAAVADLPREALLKEELIALRALARQAGAPEARDGVRAGDRVLSAKEAQERVQTAQSLVDRGGDTSTSLEDARVALVAAQAVSAASKEARRNSAVTLKRIRQIEAGLNSLTLRRRAAKLVGVIQVGDLAGQRRAWNTTVLREGKRARKAIAEKDYATAAESLERQLMAHHAVDLASRYLQDIEKEQKRVVKFYKKGEQDKLRRGGYDGAKLIVGLLDRWDFHRSGKRKLPTSRQGRHLLREAKKAKVEEVTVGLAEFARQAEGEAWVVDLDEFFLDPPKDQTSWKDLEVDHFFGLVSTINGIAKVSRAEVKTRDEQTQLTVMEAGAKMAARVRELWPELKDSGRSIPTSREMVKKQLKWADAMLLKREELLDFLGGDDITANPLREFLWEPIQLAAEQELILQEEFSSKLVALFNEVDRSNWNDDVITPSLPGLKLKYHELIVMALNYGNESNWRKLVEGYANYSRTQWSADGILEAFKLIREEDWDVVQGVWDTLEELQPKIWKMQFDLTGTEPKKIESRPFITPGGKFMKGGYFPVVYDPQRDEHTKQQWLKMDTEGLFGGSHVRPDTDHGFVEARSDSYSRPMLLDIGNIPTHIDKVIHDITHRPAIIQAWAVSRDPEFRKAVKETWGDTYVDTIDAWLKAQAKERMQHSGNSRQLQWLVRHARSNLTMMGIGYRLSTIFLQPLGLFNSTGEIGAGYMMRSLVESSLHPHQALKDVQDNSLEMTHRFLNNDREIRHEVRLLKGDFSPAAQLKRYAFHGIGFTDMLVSVITWRAQMNKSMQAHNDFARAKKEADRSVRRTQGGGLKKDLVEFQEKEGAVQFAAMFYSYASALYGQQRRSALIGQTNYVSDGMTVPIQKRRDMPRAIARWMVMVMMPQVIASYLAGYGPEDDEELWAWLLKEGVSGAVLPLPWARDLIGGFIQGRVSTSTIGRAYEAPLRFGTSLLEDDPDWEHVLRFGLQTTGYFAGLPLGQIELWVDNFWELDDAQLQDLIYRKPRDRR